jgi:hypothetical protein
MSWSNPGQPPNLSSPSKKLGVRQKSSSCCIQAFFLGWLPFGAEEESADLSERRRRRNDDRCGRRGGQLLRFGGDADFGV